MEPDRRLTVYLHLGSRSPRFMEQARKRLNELQRAVGGGSFADLGGLDMSKACGVPIRAHVVQREASGTYPAHNDIAEYTVGTAQQ